MIFSAIFFSSMKTAEPTQPRFQDFSVAVPFLSISCIIDVISLDIAQVFPIRPTLAAYEELGKENE